MSMRRIKVYEGVHVPSLYRVVYSMGLVYLRWCISCFLGVLTLVYFVCLVYIGWCISCAQCIQDGVFHVLSVYRMVNYMCSVYIGWCISCAWCI